MSKSKVFEEVRKITSDKAAEDQKSAENRYPSLIEIIKKAAAKGETSCEFSKGEIDQYAERLLKQDGFTLYLTTKTFDKKMEYLQQRPEPQSAWVVLW